MTASELEAAAVGFGRGAVFGGSWVCMRIESAPEDFWEILGIYQEQMTCIGWEVPYQRHTHTYYSTFGMVFDATVSVSAFIKGF